MLVKEETGVTSIVRTESRRISDVKKKVNTLESKNIVIVPSIELESILKNKQDRIFLEQLISMTTDMSERKDSKFCIALSYGNVRVSKEKEQKLQRVIEQLIHQLEYTTVCLFINIPGARGQNLKDNINSKHLIVSQLEAQLAAQV